jgi:hypothetical protein
MGLSGCATLRPSSMLEYMPKKTITTIEGLAEMIQRTMASKEDVQALDKKVQTLDTR